VSKVNYKPITDEALERVSRATAVRSHNQPPIRQAWYNADTQEIALEMHNQVRLSFAPGALPKLKNTSREQLARIKVTRSGNAIPGTELDIQISSVALVHHLLHLSSIQKTASLGRRARTSAQAAAR